ncbi:MAG: redoxin domain-containing protein [Phycisphaerales bacterium]
MPTRTSPAPRRLITLTGFALACVPLLAMGPKISREGDGPHRDKMSLLESAPFPIEAMADLTEWIGEPVSADVFTSGEVIAIAFIDSGNGASMTMLNSLTRMKRQRGDRGLTVFAVHGEENWDKIAGLAEDNRVRIPVLKDDGSFAEALGVDDDPDVYLIDRSGLLRYADIHSRSVDVGVAALLRETPEIAAKNAAKEAQIRQIAMEEDGPAEERRTGTGNATKADPADYASARWPEHNKGSINATSFQGKQLPVRLGGETWLTDRQELSGKVIVLDFWATWCGPCRRVMPTLDQLQTRNQNDLAILGVGGQSESMSTVRSYLASNKHAYGQLYDARQRIYGAMNVRAIPHAVIISTDGVIRWQGNPLDSKFRPALEQVLRVDPGISRNQSEEESDG